jgi:two-component system NarL family sensor kinase
LRRIDAEVLRFALSGIAAVILLGAAGVYLLQHVGQSEATRDAKQISEVAGRGAVEPFVTPALERGQPAAIAQLDQVVHHALLQSQIVRVKIWTRDGRIVYSDEHRLIGQQYRLASDDLRAFTQGTTEAGVSDLTRPENRFERRFGKLLEVYLPIRDSTGRKLLFEDYERYSSVAASGRRLWIAFAPAIVGVLVLLWLVQLPLVWRGARRLRHAQAERERFLSQAIQASETERRRIARDLHDGAVQNLAGVSYSLTAAADRIGSLSSDESAAAMREAASSTRGTIKELRSLLVDIYPPDLHRTGLEAAVRDLVASLAPRGVAAHVDVPGDLDLRPEIETLFYRCTQEALRNVAAHADASEVTVRVETLDGRVRLRVGDNGRGFAPEAAAQDGHFGLVMLADLASELGGRLDIQSEPGSGTCVQVDAPL